MYYVEDEWYPVERKDNSKKYKRINLNIEQREVRISIL